MSLTKVTNSMIKGAVVNVLDKGAIGNGIADDTLAIQAAMNACAKGQIVYFPAGFYRCTDTLVPVNEINYLGDGMGSQMFMVSDKTLLAIDTQREISISGLAMFSAATTATTSIVELTNVHASNIDVFVLGGYSGLTLAGCLLNQVRVHASINTYQDQVFPGWTLSIMQRAINIKAAGGIATNANTFINPVVEGIDFGVFCSSTIKGETDNQFIGGSLEGCRVGMYLENLYQPTAVIGTHFEANGEYDIYSITSDNITVENCYLGSSTLGSVELINCKNIVFNNCYIRTLNVNANCTYIKTRDCVVRVTKDYGKSSDFVNTQYTNTGSVLPYGPSDSYSYGRSDGLLQKIINTNTDLKIWTAPTVPDGYVAVGSATIAKDLAIFRTGSFSTKVTAPYGPAAYAGLGFSLPAGVYDGQIVNIEAMVYSSNGAIISVGIGATGGWAIGLNNATSGWVRTVLSIVVPTGSTHVVVFAALDDATNTSINVDSIKVYATA